MNWLLLFVPITIGLEFLSPERYLLIFAASCLAILPLAGWMGRATEQLAERLGEGVGGLLNATFGNAAELIIALAALRAGLYDVVKASIAGSIIGNILLVLGAAMLCGGLRRPEQHFNPAGARSQATMLTLAAIALILPAAFQAAAHTTAAGLGRLSVAIAVVLLLRLSVEPGVRPGHPCRAVHGLSCRRGTGATSIRGARRSGACRCHGGNRLDERDHGGGDRTHGA